MNMKLNKQVRFIFKEVIKDAEHAIACGNISAIEIKKKFELFLKYGFVPTEEIGFLYNYYQQQEKSLIGLTGSHYDSLKSEVSYMVNYLNSLYTFKDLGGAIAVTKKEG